ncbi:MAG: hypothetical protein U0V72_02330 [Cytophagales bacterium]
MYRFFLGLVLTVGLVSCKSYYSKLQSFNYYFESGNYSEAEKRYQNVDKPKGHNQLLYYMNMGMLNHLQGKYELSNQFFESAYIFTQDNFKNVSADFASVFVSSSVNKYLGNPLEVQLINYYKALNYIQLNQIDKAMVECRRAIQVSQFFDDKFSGNKKFQRDPFVFSMIGLIFEMGGDYDNALFCLKKSISIYQSENLGKIGIGVPDQLKSDVIRLAKIVGDQSAVETYTNQFGQNYSQSTKPKNTKEIILLWHNGLCPVKKESNLMFNINSNGGGNVMFLNDDLGLNIPVVLPVQNFSALNIMFIRMALPNYKERYLVFNSAQVKVDSNKTVKMELAQDFNAVDKKILKDQLLTNITQSLIRVTMRQVLAAQASKENQALGIGLSLAGAIFEKADTRNWQSLPHSVYYTRIYVPEHKKNLELEFNGTQNKNISINIEKLSNKNINLLTVTTPEFNRYQ